MYSGFLLCFDFGCCLQCESLDMEFTHSISSSRQVCGERLKAKELVPPLKMWYTYLYRYCLSCVTLNVA